LINKILWASDNSTDSIDSLEYAEFLAKSMNAEIIGLYVIPEYFEVEVMEEFPTEEIDMLADWIKETESKESDRLSVIADDVRAKGIAFSTRISQGAPHTEIIKRALEDNADLIVLGKGRADDKAILGATALKVLRRSPVPVLVAKKQEEIAEIKRICVPTDLYNIDSGDMRFALEFKGHKGSEIYSLSVVETGEGKYPPEVVERLRGNAYNNLTKGLEDAGVATDVNAVVKTSKNAVQGILEFVREKDIDLIVMNTYEGGEFRREEFIGSVAERVVQESPSAVITVRPS